MVQDLVPQSRSTCAVPYASIPGPFSNVGLPHLIFANRHEGGLRTMMHRDRNHPSVVVWSFSNEVSEQQIGDPSTVPALELHGIVREERDSGDSIGGLVA
ncbi:beta-galactosidase [Colletotrichum kahawae]|uniref:Beta-galactosidase n=1 Tax=Colletotrichum kahawae TaxID=34407 RepID=A0AAD9YM71_COLKA|nr:beta-galactosidase [Colletotrichum kahawae]